AAGASVAKASFAISRVKPVYKSISLKFIDERRISNVGFVERDRGRIFRHQKFTQRLHSWKRRPGNPLKYRHMKGVEFFRCLSIFNVHVALQQRYYDVRSCLEQMNRLDKALHDVHYELAIRGDQLVSSREYRGAVEGIHRKRIPTVASLAGKAEIDRQRARVYLSGG